MAGGMVGRMLVQMAPRRAGRALKLYSEKGGTCMVRRQEEGGGRRREE
jgi:hypothetical protein